jgi:hypothetical protein
LGDDIDCDLVGGTELQVLKQQTDKPPLAVTFERLQEPTSSPEAKQQLASLAQRAKGLEPGVFAKALGLLDMTPSDLLQAMGGTMGAIEATSRAAAKGKSSARRQIGHTATTNQPCVPTPADTMAPAPGGTPIVRQRPGAKKRPNTLTKRLGAISNGTQLLYIPPAPTVVPKGDLQPKHSKRLKKI